MDNVKQSKRPNYYKILENLKEIRKMPITFTPDEQQSLDEAIDIIHDLFEEEMLIEEALL